MKSVHVLPAKVPEHAHARRYAKPNVSERRIPWHIVSCAIRSWPSPIMPCRPFSLGLSFCAAPNQLQSVYQCTAVGHVTRAEFAQRCTHYVGIDLPLVDVRLRRCFISTRRRYRFDQRRCELCKRHQRVHLLESVTAVSFIFFPSILPLLPDSDGDGRANCQDRSPGLHPRCALSTIKADCKPHARLIPRHPRLLGCVSTVAQEVVHG